jgi:hemerythrin-like domain-containing protein
VKRHEALAQLSRDHHQALFQAMRLMRATGDDAAEVLENFLDFWVDVCRLHFRGEEEVLLPALAGYADPSHDAVVRVLVDHVAIRLAAHDLGDLRGEVDVEALRSLGRRLEAHVRHEERVLFPMVEALLPDPELSRVARELEEVERAL